jgi:hypothetical protein
MRFLARPLLALLLVGEAISISLAVQRTYYVRQVLIYESLAIVLFLAALALFAHLRAAGAGSRWFVLGTGAALQLLALRKPPVDSDDDFRYIWDGKVQLAGIDPYRYAPSSPGLRSVRDGYLFPNGQCTHYPLSDGSCTRINLPDVHTIYPPVAEAAFAVVRFLSFGRGGQFPLQLAAAIGALAIAFVLARGGRSLWTVALWSWCPVTVMELGNNAHIDWLAVLLGVLALTAAGRGRILLAGILLGAGVATKLYPGLLGAALLKRRPWVMVGAAVGTVVLVYIPHVAAVGTSVVGYLPTYLNQGGYGDGRQYRLLSLVLPNVACTPVAVLILVATVGWALLRADPTHPERAALIVVGVSVLVATPTLPWYSVFLLALAALAARPEWLGVVLAPTVEYLLVGAGHADLGNATSYSYLAGGILLAAGTILRRRQGAGYLTGPHPPRAVAEVP